MSAVIAECPDKLRLDINTCVIEFYDCVDPLLYPTHRYLHEVRRIKTYLETIQEILCSNKGLDAILNTWIPKIITEINHCKPFKKYMQIGNYKDERPKPLKKAKKLADLVSKYVVSISSVNKYIQQLKEECERLKNENTELRLSFRAADLNSNIECC